MVGCLGVDALEIGPSPPRLAGGFKGEGSFVRQGMREAVVSQMMVTEVRRGGHAIGCWNRCDDQVQW